jgi:hypothetical protein
MHSKRRRVLGYVLSARPARLRVASATMLCDTKAEL